MLEWIQVTAQYSNAVLVAILPQISDFVQRAGLPMPSPVTLEQVARLKCSPLKGEVGGAVILTNGLWLLYLQGHVDGFRTPRSYYNLQHPRDIPKFYGPLRLNEEEALRFARESIRKLGYTLKETFADQEPEIDLPPQIGTNLVPHYRFQWKDPVFGRTAVSIEIDAGAKLIQEMRLSSPFFWRAPPKVAVEPKARNPKPPVSAVVSNEFLAATLPKISEFASKLGLPFSFPVTRTQVERIEFVAFDWDVRTKLTNGYWFIAKKGVISEFNAPDSVYGRQPPALEPIPRPLEEYLGEWKLSEKKAIELVYQAIRRLGYKLEDFHADRPPDAARPEPVGKYIVPRYSFRWLANDPATGETVALVRAEVDADKKSLKHLQLVGKPLPEEAQTGENPAQRPASGLKPPARLPMILDTNVAREWSIEELLEDADPARNGRAKLPQKPELPVRPPNPFE